MKFNFENAGINTYLVYQIQDDDVLDTMSLGMLTNNKISGLASTIYTQMDAEKFIKYNVSAKISVKQFFSGPVNRARLLGVFNGIVNAMLSAEDYMINSDSILMDTDYIFSDVSTCETILICLPVQTEGQTVDLGAFFKNIMFNTQFDQTENCDYVARIINHLNSVPVFSLLEFKSVLDSLESNVSKSSNSQQSQTVKSENTQQTVIQHTVQDMKSSVEVVKPAQPVAEMKTTVQPVVPQSVVSQKPMEEKRSFDIPGDTRQQKPEVEPETDGKKITMFDLLMHYNSENAAAYKAQKAAKKNGSVATEKATSVPAAKKGKGSEKKKKADKSASTSFAIPGQATQITQTTNQTQPSSQQVEQVAQNRQSAVTPIPEVINTSSQQPVIQRPVQPISTGNFGETTVLGGGVAGETTVLNAGASVVQQINPHLVRAKNNEIIPINKPVFRIGKEKSYVDYFVADNTAISRSHANIIIREDKYFIVDTNSTNHTFIDGQMIPSSTEIEITHGTKIRLANEDFTFQLY